MGEGVAGLMRPHLNICPTVSVIDCVVAKDYTIMRNYYVDIYCLDIVTVQVRSGRLPTAIDVAGILGALGWSVCIA